MFGHGHSHDGGCPSQRGGGGGGGTPQPHPQQQMGGYEMLGAEVPQPLKAAVYEEGGGGPGGVEHGQNEADKPPQEQLSIRAAKGDVQGVMALLTASPQLLYGYDGLGFTVFHWAVLANTA